VFAYRRLARLRGGETASEGAVSEPGDTPAI
jgi:hypothetical protein